MSSIGSISFMSMSGEPIPTLSMAVETFVRRGVDGVGFRTTSKKSRTVQKRTIKWFAFEADALDAVDDYAQLKGEVVSVTEETGRSISDVLVLDVITNQAQRISNSVPAGYNWQVEAVWQLQPTQE